MKTLILILMMAIAGCGNRVDIEYRSATMQELEAKAGYPALGYAWRDWDYIEFKWDCTIWLAPLDEYSSAACFSDVIEHEKRHCRRGSFHANTPEASAISSCYAPG